MKTKLFLLCAFALIALVACAAPPPTATLVPLPDPGSLIKDLVGVLNAGNIEAATAFFADDATQTQQPPPSGTSGVRTGKEQIRGFYKGLLDDHFSVELSNVKVAGDKVTYTCTFSTDSYKKMGVAPLVTVEEAVFVGGKIKSQTITVTPESLEKIQAAMAAVQAKSTTQKKVLVLISVEISNDMELMLTKEVGVMVSMLEKAGYKTVVASPSGQPLVGGTATLKPDLKLADVKGDDYAGFILPCLSPGTAAGFGPKPPEAIELVKKAVAQGKPVAAQLSAVDVLSKAGVLKGKQISMISQYVQYFPDAIPQGTAVVQDGNIITSAICPNAAKIGGVPDETAEFTQKFIDALASAR